MRRMPFKPPEIEAPPTTHRSWWHRVQWFDVVLVLFAVFALLLLTAELWLPHASPLPWKR